MHEFGDRISYIQSWFPSVAPMSGSLQPANSKNVI